jgi:large subunit ribosomal protein L18
LPTSRYIHLFRRRREGKTDYRKRKGIILGKSPFVAVHISGRYIYSQLLKPSPTGDLTVAAASSRDLVKKFGWKGSTKNLPGAYLTGYYLGHLAGQKNLKEAVVYSGVGRFVHGSRLASLIDGAKDAGLNISVDEESLPDEDRISGKHIADYSTKLDKEDKEKHDQLFSKILSSGFNPSDYPAHFESVKTKIDAGGNKVTIGS